MKFVFGLRIRDVDCDFRLIRRATLDEVELVHTTGVICVELVRKLQDVDARFTEVGVHHYRRVHGTSEFFRVGAVVRTLRRTGRLVGAARGRASTPVPARPHLVNVEKAKSSSSPLMVEGTRPGPPPDDRHDRWAWSADGAFALLVVGTIVCYLVKANSLGFLADDWRLAQRGGSIGDYFQPYNDTLNVVPIALYHSLYTVFGFQTAFPLRLLSVVSGAAVAVALFLAVRARVGSVVALVVGATFLWYPNFVVNPSAFDHYLALTAIILCVWLLTKDGVVADVSLAVAFAFALCTAGLAVAAGAGLLTYVLLARGAAVAVARRPRAVGRLDDVVAALADDP